MYVEIGGKEINTAKRVTKSVPKSGHARSGNVAKEYMKVLRGGKESKCRWIPLSTLLVSQAALPRKKDGVPTPALVGPTRTPCCLETQVHASIP